MSSSTFRRWLAVSTAYTIVTLTAVHVEAQTVSRTKASASPEELHQAAAELHALHDRLGDAARLHQQSARLRSTDDPQAIECLALAAHLQLYTDRPLAARRTMEQAADRALSIGSVERAAQAFLEAAFIAQRRGDDGEVQRFAWRAYLLTASPLLTGEQRSAIRDRITRELPVVARAGRP